MVSLVLKRTLFLDFARYEYKPRDKGSGAPSQSGGTLSDKRD